MLQPSFPPSRASAALSGFPPLCPAPGTSPGVALSADADGGADFAGVLSGFAAGTSVREPEGDLAAVALASGLITGAPVAVAVACSDVPVLPRPADGASGVERDTDEASGTEAWFSGDVSDDAATSDVRSPDMRRGGEATSGLSASARRQSRAGRPPRDTGFAAGESSAPESPIAPPVALPDDPSLGIAPVNAGPANARQLGLRSPILPATARTLLSGPRGVATGEPSERGAPADAPPMVPGVADGAAIDPRAPAGIFCADPDPATTPGAAAASALTGDKPSAGSITALSVAPGEGPSVSGEPVFTARASAGVAMAIAGPAGFGPVAAGPLPAATGWPPASEIARARPPSADQTAPEPTALQFGDAQPTASAGAVETPGVPRTVATTAENRAEASAGVFPAAEPGKRRGPPVGAGRVFETASKPSGVEKIAGLVRATATKAGGGEVAGVKKILDADNQAVEKSGDLVGTGVANSALTMPYSSNFPMPAAAHGQSVWAAASVPSGPGEVRETMPLPPAASTAQAVETVLDAAQVAADTRRGSVELQFSVGGAELRVQVALSGDDVQATFRTDSPELRQALAQEWDSVVSAAGAAERGLRLLPAIFTASESAPAAGQGSGFAFAGGDQSAAQRDAQARRGDSSRDAAGTRRHRAAGLAASPGAGALSGSSRATLSTSRHLHTHA